MTGRRAWVAAEVSVLMAAGALVGCSGESEPQAASPASSSGDAARGAEVFKLQCAACHGATGHGDGVGAAALAVKPRNLTSEPYKYVDIAGAASEQAALVAYIQDGKIENGMPPFAHLPAADLQALAAFVKSIRPKPNFVEEKPPADPPEGGGVAPDATTEHTDTPQESSGG